MSFVKKSVSIVSKEFSNFPRNREYFLGIFFGWNLNWVNGAYKCLNGGWKISKYFEVFREDFVVVFLNILNGWWIPPHNNKIFPPKTFHPINFHKVLFPTFCRKVFFYSVFLEKSETSVTKPFMNCRVKYNVYDFSQTFHEKWKTFFYIIYVFLSVDFFGGYNVLVLCCLLALFCEFISPYFYSKWLKIEITKTLSKFIVKCFLLHRLTYSTLCVGDIKIQMAKKSSATVIKNTIIIFYCAY